MGKLILFMAYYLQPSALRHYKQTNTFPTYSTSSTGGIGNEDCSQSIILFLCCSFIFTLYFYSSLCSPSWDSTLPELILCKICTGCSSSGIIPVWVCTIGPILQHGTSRAAAPSDLLLHHRLLSVGCSPNLGHAPEWILHGMQPPSCHIH